MSHTEIDRPQVAVAAEAPKATIVNEAFAKKSNLERDAVGRCIGSRDGKLDTETVGLVQNAKYSEVMQVIPPLFFRPYRQDDQVGFLSFHVRTSRDPEQLLTGISKVVVRLDPNLPVENLRTMPQQVRENVFMDRIISVDAGHVVFFESCLVFSSSGLSGQRRSRRKCRKSTAL